MLVRLRFARICTLAVALLAHPVAVASSALAGTVPVGAVDGSDTGVDNTADPADTAASGAAAGGSGPGVDLGIAAAACGAGMHLAGGDPWHLTGTGIATCLVGICFEIADFLNDHRP